MHRKIIWVLEDDFQQIELLEEILGSTYRIRSFRTIEEVSRCIHDAEWPDLFLLDFNLPDGNLLNLIKKYPMIGFHFIVISADYSLSVYEHSFLEGALDWVYKPLTGSELKAKIERSFVRRRAELERENTYKQKIVREMMKVLSREFRPGLKSRDRVIELQPCYPRL